MRSWIIVLISIMITAGNPPVLAKKLVVNQRPRIGLALSGGGGRGFAHIGVLEWMEEHRIPVDYIAGTSMGGLVGAMYAMGMSPSQIRDLIEQIDWEEILQETPSYNQLAYRRKEDRRSFPNAIELGLRGGLRTPVGLNPGHAIGLLLDHVTLPYYAVKSFDALPIPFRCVATDMLTAKAVILKDGSLSHALRATMAIPGLFTPVEMDGKVLADGVLLNNLPTDVVKGMGADIVIAIDVGTPLGDRDAIESLFGMLAQSVDVMTIQSVRRNLKLADVIVWPDLDGYGSLDFERLDELIDLGYKGAQEKAVVLEKFALNETAWQEVLAQRQSRVRRDVPSPTAIEVGVPNPRAAELLSHKLNKHIHHHLQLDLLEADLTAIAGWGRYQSLGYELRHRGGQDELHIRVKDKTYGPPFLHLGLDVSGVRKNDTDFTLTSRLTLLDVGGYGSEWRTDANLGSSTVLATEFYRPISDRGWFVAPRLFFERNTQDLFVDRSRVAEYRLQRAGLGLDFGYVFGRRNEVRLGYDIGHLKTTVTIGGPTLPNLKGRATAASFKWTYDGRDSALIPTRGLRVNATANWIFETPGARDQFARAEINMSAFRPLSEKNTLFVVGAGGTTFSQTAPPEQQFTLGGPLRLGAYGEDEFRGSHFLLSNLGFLHQLTHLPLLLGGKVYLSTWGEWGSAFEAIDLAEQFYNLSGGLILETRIGPIFLGGSWGKGGRGNIYFSIGRIF